jgi:hypothetical protein
MRVVVAITLAVLSVPGLAVAGAWAGAYAGFHRVGVPSGPHCGLAVLPALFGGAIPGGLIGLLLALAAPTDEEDPGMEFDD